MIARLLRMRPRGRLALAGALLFANAAVAAVMLLPSWIEVRKTRLEAEDVRSRVAASRLAVEKAARAARLRDSAGVLSARLPARRDVPDVVRTLQSLAHDHDVDFLGLAAVDAGKSGPPRGQARPVPHSFQVPLEGEYAAIRAFVHAVESAEWFFAVRDLSIQKVRGEERVRMQMTVTTLVKPEA